ncbi:MAG: ATP-binding cassette, subfamily bacterial, partial [Thermomicrobiales bacterium]|nr:ATP-binding cassette, subfamily bacterial [Thermomicrobiales bacterium]
MSPHPSSNGRSPHENGHHPIGRNGSVNGTPRPRMNPRSAARAIRNTWRSLVRVFGLVWSTSRRLTIALAAVTLLQSVVPVAQVWLAGRLIDEVVHAIGKGGGDDHVRPVVILAVAQLLLFLGSSLLQTLGNISQQLLQEQLAIHVQLLIMEHANSLDLADFENAAYYDQLQQAQRESANRPVAMVAGVFSLVRTAITFATMIALLIGLSPWIAAAALLSPIPAFISGSRYGWWGFQQMRRQSPTRRLMSYLTTLLTTDEFNKEIKLYTLGDHFIDRYRTIAGDYYQDTR